MHFPLDSTIASVGTSSSSCTARDPTSRTNLGRVRLDLLIRFDASKPSRCCPCCVQISCKCVGGNTHVTRGGRQAPVAVSYLGVVLTKQCTDVLSSCYALFCMQPTIKSRRSFPSLITSTSNLTFASLILHSNNSLASSTQTV